MNNRKKKPSVGKIILFAVELVLLVVLLVVLWVVLKATDEDKGVDRITIKEADIRIEMNETVQQNEAMKGYRNIALFGVDSRKGELKSKTRSDTIMVASINLETNEVKLVSVYRDTFLNLKGDNERYEKCNAAYAYGGAEQAIKMLNANLDLDITDFISIGFEGVKDLVDALGGVYIEIDEAELKHINNYQIKMVEDLNLSGYVPVTETGYQKLDGLQAMAYCRIRYTSGSDFARTARQREVIKACLDVAKTVSPTSLANICNNVFSEIYTSLELKEILEILSSITQYSIVDEGGFPQYPEGLYVGPFGSNGDCIVPTTLESNVSWLHGFLFNEQDYEVSSEVKEFSDYIADQMAKKDQ